MFIWHSQIKTKVIKSKIISYGQGKAFDGTDLWIFGNDFARIIVVFGAENMSSIHAIIIIRTTSYY